MKMFQGFEQNFFIQGAHRSLKIRKFGIPFSAHHLSMKLICFAVFWPFGTTKYNRDYHVAKVEIAAE
jgi:hypothetical protein